MTIDKHQCVVLTVNTKTNTVHWKQVALMYPQPVRDRLALRSDLAAERRQRANARRRMTRARKAAAPVAATDPIVQAEQVAQEAARRDRLGEAARAEALRDIEEAAAAAAWRYERAAFIAAPENRWMYDAEVIAEATATLRELEV